ncbi:MAG: radical SAM protein, partial [Flavobacteriales bacterium]|nr:radical SAM protein [Flavobacteriales bacterium]
ADPDAPGQLRRNPPRPILTDLDALPLPAWDLAEVERYRAAWTRRHGFFSLNQITTRGCPFRCNWCAKPVYGDRYQTRGPARVVEELALVVERYQPDHIWFADDILGLKKNWLLEFSDRVAEARLARRFMCQTRVDLMTPGNVAALARAGCEEVWMGAESGDPGVLAAMEKGITPDQTRAAVERLKAEGIKVALFLQFGYPGEGWEEIGRT